jgi:hypothetical protein
MEALKKAWKWEAGSKVVNARENGSTDDLGDMFPFHFQPLLQPPREGTKPPQHVCIPKSNI